MSQHNQVILEKKLEKYEALKQRIAHSIERVVNKEILEKSKSNIEHTLKGVKLIRKNFQNEFRTITVELHKDLLAHFENFQLADSGFNQMHEYYLKFIEKLDEKHLAMTSECDDIVSKIEEIYKQKMEDIKETERQLIESKQQLSQQEQMSEKMSEKKSLDSDRGIDSPNSDRPISSRESSSHKHHLGQSQGSQSKSGLLGKIFGGKPKEGTSEPVTQMKLGDEAKFKWDPVKKRYIFEGEDEQVEEDVPMPPKMMESKKKKKEEEAPKEQAEQDKSQLGKSDMLKPHTSNLGFMRKKQGSGGPKQAVGVMKPVSVFAPSMSSQGDTYSSEPTSETESVRKEKQEKPLHVKVFEELETLLYGLELGHLSSSSYLQPLNEIVALAKEDAEHLSDNQSELDTFKSERDVFKSERDVFKSERDVFKSERDVFKSEGEAYRAELEKAYNWIKTYEALSSAKDQAIGIVMQSEKQTTQQLISIRGENELLQSSLDFYKDLMESKASTADEDSEEHGLRSFAKDGRFEALLNELALQETVARLSDEVNHLRIREAELETKCKLAEERSELFKNRMEEEQEREFHQLYAFLDERSGKEDIALKFMTRSYELGQKLEARGKKIRALNGLCRQISDEVREKNNQISELSTKLKRTGERVEEKEAEIESKDERIRGLENELGLAAKDKKLINSLQLENSTLHKSLENSKKRAFNDK